MITRRRRRRVATVAAAAAALILTGCRAPLDPGLPGATQAAAGRAGTAASPPAAAALAVAAGQVSLIQEPDPGYGPIYTAITGARSTLDITMYELADPAAQAD